MTNDTPENSTPENSAQTEAFKAYEQTWQHIDLVMRHLACQRHADGDINKSIEVNTARFALSPQLVEILRNTVPWVQDAFVGLNNQQDIQPPI